MEIENTLLTWGWSLSIFLTDRRKRWHRWACPWTSTWSVSGSRAAWSSCGICWPRCRTLVSRQWRIWFSDWCCWLLSDFADRAKVNKTLFFWLGSGNIFLPLHFIFNLTDRSKICRQKGGKSRVPECTTSVYNWSTKNNRGF